MKKLQFIIPASTSNIGPGFDTLGIALQLYNELVVEESDRKLAIEFDRGVDDIFRHNIRRLVRRTVRAFESASGETIIGVKMIFRNDIPIARGLGSSATFRLGTLVALNEWTKKPLNPGKLLDIGCRIERHTENCVTSMVGGLTVSGFINDAVMYTRHNIRGNPTFIAAIPDRPMSTSETRKTLPRRINFSDAVFNINRTALLPDVFTSGNFERLGDLLVDKLHQPFRAKIMKPLFKVIRAACEAGAWGAFLSGSGSTIMAVATKNIDDIAKAMKSTLEENGWPANISLLKSDTRGIRSIPEK